MIPLNLEAIIRAAVIGELVAALDSRPPNRSIISIDGSYHEVVSIEGFRAWLMEQAE